MVNGVVSFIRPPRSLLLFLPNFLKIRMVIFAQEMMLCNYQYYISLVAESFKNIGVSGTSKI